MSANIYSFYNDAFWSEKSKGKGYLPFEIFREQGNDKVGAIFGANATSLGFTTLLTDKCKGTVLTKDGKPTEELIYSTYNLKQLNPKTNRVYLINEQTKAVDAQTQLVLVKKIMIANSYKHLMGQIVVILLICFQSKHYIKVILKLSFMLITHIPIMKKII